MFAPSPLTPGAARQFARETMALWDLSADDDVVLVVDELVTNASIHAVGLIYLAMNLDEDVVRVEVKDDSPALPASRPQSETRTSGRGLAIVDALSREWGAHSHPNGGKAVWADVLLTSNG